MPPPLPRSSAPTPLQQQEGWKKPTPDAPGEQKRSYIQAKYVWKGFVEGSNGRLEGDRWGGTSSSDHHANGGDFHSGDGGGGSSRGGGGSSHSRRSSRDGGGSVNGVGGGRGSGTERWSLRLSECAASGDLAGAVEALAHGEEGEGT